jgi:hypothetical protein
MVTCIKQYSVIGKLFLLEIHRRTRKNSLFPLFAYTLKVQIRYIFLVSFSFSLYVRHVKRDLSVLI